MARFGVQAPAANGNAKAVKKQRPNYKEASDSDEDVPLKDKILPQRAAAKQGSKRKSDSRADAGQNKKARKSALQPSKPSRSKPHDGEQRWTKLHHSGVLFPPEYEVHGMRMLYEGKPVDLTPEQEEVATMFAVMKETDYAKKDQFLGNFWDAFKPILGKGHIIKDLKKCDFSPIYEWHMAERDKRKGLPREVRIWPQCIMAVCHSFGRPIHESSQVTCLSCDIVAYLTAMFSIHQCFPGPCCLSPGQLSEAVT